MVKTVKDAFSNGKAFIAFITAGDPNLAKTEEFILEMERAGADLIEIGIPFSDPIAEGVVIQEADLRALQSGTTTDAIFDMVKRLRQKTDMPLVFMGYLNPVFHYGYERFFARCEEAGISGIIIPDLPYEEKGECAQIAAAHGVDVISMIAPTSEARIQMIAGDAGGFLYVVSSMGVTRDPNALAQLIRGGIRHQYARAGGEDRRDRGRRDRRQRHRQACRAARGGSRPVYLRVREGDEGCPSNQLTLKLLSCQPTQSSSYYQLTLKSVSSAAWMV